MTFRTFAAAGLSIALTFTAAGNQKKTDPKSKKALSLGDKIVSFCEENKGKQVGDGECTALATEAFKAVGAKPQGKDDPKEGDYVWGDRVFTLEASELGQKPNGKLTAIKPGDVIQFRDSKFVVRSGSRTDTFGFPHHTAVIKSVELQGEAWRILHQNFNGKKEVIEHVLLPATLTEGWVRVYRPLTADVGGKAEKERK
jgi:hypothetical protein